MIEGDADGYWRLAQTIVHGEEYSIYTPPRRVLRMPGFPLVLAGAMSVAGEDHFRVRLFLALTGVAACYLVYLLGKELTDIDNDKQAAAPPAPLATAQAKAAPTEDQLPGASDSNQEIFPGLNILMLTQTTREQRTRLLEELLKLDADLVQQVVQNSNSQKPPQANIRTVQQVAMTGPATTNAVSADFAQPGQQTPPMDSAVHIQKDTPTQIIASYRGVTLKTQGK
ncbi:MAG: hypothetical protein RLO18_16100, partial [Gimesia chilikensis]